MPWKSAIAWPCLFFVEFLAVSHPEGEARASLTSWRAGASSVDQAHNCALRSPVVGVIADYLGRWNVQLRRCAYCVIRRAFA
jgi:hypothetical protein